MKAADVARGVWEAMEARDWARARSLLSDDLVTDWPQTRERIRGGDNFIALNSAYPGDWHITVEEALGDGDRAAVRATIVNGAEIFHASGFYEVRDGRIVRSVEFFADPGAPPYDRSRWAERY
jgi:ketosteroid isomerase-like protein